MNRNSSGQGPSLLAALLVGLALASPLQAADAPRSSAEQARQSLAVLQSNAPAEEKALACKRLAVFAGPESVAALAPLLGDERLASWARIPLEVIPGQAADDALREAMGRLYGNLLVGVINSIGVRGDTKAVEPLAGRLKDANAEVAAAAAIALGRIGGSAAVSALEAALGSGPVVVRSAVAEGLVVSAERSVASGDAEGAARLYDAVRRSDLPPQRILEATRGAILARQAAGLPLLLETLRSPDRDTFDIGLRTIRELPGQAITEALAAELNRTPAERQGRLLLALTDRSDAAVQPAVLGAIKQGSKSLRLVAIGVLERQANPASLPALLEASIDADAEVSKAAKTALGRLPGKELDNELVKRLPQSTGATRQVLVELAGQRHVAAAVPELFKAASDSEADLRSAGIKALGETVSVSDLGTLTDLLAKAKSEDDQADIEGALDAACTRLTDRAGAAEALLSRFDASSPAARCALLRVLGTVGTPKALAAARGSLTHADATVREAAFRVLADWPESSAVPALVEVIRSPADETQRTLALRGAVRLLGLGDQPPVQTAKTYGELLALARRVEDRKLVLSGLGSVPDLAAVKLVEPLLADEGVKKEAESALLGIAGALAGSAPAEARALATRLQKDASDPATRDRAGQLLQRTDKFEDYLIAWQFAGAYKLASGESGSLFAREFPPEKGEGSVTWRPLAAGTQAARPWMMDLLATKTGDARCVGYARTWVHSDLAQPARVEFGTDDGHKLWCNGEPVAQADRGGAAVPGEFKSIVSLRQGWNALLLKVVQDSGPWEFCLRLRTSSGAKLEGLRVQAMPPEK
jgi:HEAT repeat protein